MSAIKSAINDFAGSPLIVKQPLLGNFSRYNATCVETTINDFVVAIRCRSVQYLTISFVLLVAFSRSQLQITVLSKLTLAAPVITIFSILTFLRLQLPQNESKTEQSTIVLWLVLNSKSNNGVSHLVVSGKSTIHVIASHLRRYMYVCICVTLFCFRTFPGCENSGGKN